MIQNYRGKAPNSHVHTHTGREARRGPRAMIPDPDLPGEGSKGRTSVEEPEGAPGQFRQVRGVKKGTAAFSKEQGQTEATGLELHFWLSLQAVRWAAWPGTGHPASRCTPQGVQIHTLWPLPGAILARGTCTTQSRPSTCFPWPWMGRGCEVNPGAYQGGTQNRPAPPLTPALLALPFV